jgi:hypothetical protein
MAVSTSQWAMERRNHPRVRAAIQAEIRREHSESVLRVETADVSPGGFYVEMMFTLEVGSRLDVVLWLGAEKLTARAIVVTQHPHVGNGIKFLDMRPEDQERLRSLLVTIEANGGVLPWALPTA